MKRKRLVRGGRWRRLADLEAPVVVEHWRAALGITHSVRLERICCQQVTNERGGRGCSLVGVVCDADSACIYHTRALTPEDIVHELLHVAHPSWTEAVVVAETNRLLSLRQSEAPPRMQRSRVGAVPPPRAAVDRPNRLESEAYPTP